MHCTKDDKAVSSHFEVTFPLILAYNGSFSITFTLQRGTTLEFKQGVYYLHGDNGSGKTTFLNMLALTTGNIGKKACADTGAIKFNGQAYNAKGFDYIGAAEIREKSYCIFPQKVFFLPVSTRDNYMVLNGSDKQRAQSFSSQEYPDLLSGGQQQKTLMDIVLDAEKPVWFLDEPLTNLDAERRYYFWTTLARAYQKKLTTIFFIDHWMGKKIKADKHFQHLSTLQVLTENRQKNSPPETGSRHIQIFENNNPQDFFSQQIQQVQEKKVVKKSVNPLFLRKDQGVKGKHEE